MARMMRASAFAVNTLGMESTTAIATLMNILAVTAKAGLKKTIERQAHEGHTSRHLSSVLTSSEAA